MRMTARGTSHVSAVRRCITVLAVLLQVLPAGSRAAPPPPSAPAAVAESIATFDRLEAPGSTPLQRRLVVLEGVLTFGAQSCSTALRWDPARGVTVGCLQFGLLGRLQPVMTALDSTRPDLFAHAFGARTEEVRAMLRLRSTEEQAAWGRSLSDGGGQLKEPWATSFARLVSLPEFQTAYVESTNQRFHTAVEWAHRFGLRSSRGLAMMFDLSLYRGIAPADMEPLAAAADGAAAGKHGTAAELARLQAIAAARIAIEPNDALLRFHLQAIAAGGAVFDGATIDFAALGISLATTASQPGEHSGPFEGPSRASAIPPMTR